MEIHQIIAKNISEYRKLNKLTQNQLAEQVNFSDKSVSKWERGESIPDIAVLYQICQIFGITLNDLVSQKSSVKKVKKFDFRNKIVISLLSGGLVWLVATLSFVLLQIFAPAVTNAWLCFIYAIPLSTIVILVFACIWGKKWMQFILITILIWTIIVSLCLSIGGTSWLFIYVGIPLQILTLLWFGLKFNKKDKTKKTEPDKDSDQKEETPQTQSE